MNTSNSLTVNKDMSIHLDDDSDDIWNDLSGIDPFDIKKEEIAVNLAGLMVSCNQNRTYISDKTGWAKSRVTNVLSGEMNLTLKTLWEFASSLGYNFDVIFRVDSESPADQPWIKKHKANISFANVVNKSYTFMKEYNITPIFLAQTAHEVAKDFIVGNNKSMYFSLVGTHPHNEALQLTDITVLNKSSISNSLIGDNFVDKSLHDIPRTHYIRT